MTDNRTPIRWPQLLLALAAFIAVAWALFGPPWGWWK